MRRALPVDQPAKLAKALSVLDARERRIVELRNGIGEARSHSLAQIGRRFGISRERVRQIEIRALKKILAADSEPLPKPAKGPGRRRACLPREVLQASTLLLLRGAPAHGYELRTQLQRPGEQLGPRLYRLLRELEQSGLVRSDWAQSADGPERRIYCLTSKGGRQLAEDAQGLKPLLEILQRFFTDYEGAGEPPGDRVGA